MDRGEFTDLLNSLQQAVRKGSDLSAAPAADAARLLHLDALTLTLRTTPGALELLWADPCDPLGPPLEDLQYTVGEGPTLDAARTGHTVAESDLNAASADRWPLFTPAACELSARAVIAVPLLLGVATAGVLTGARTTPGPFTTAQRQDLTRFARVALDLVLHTPLQSLTTGTHGPELHRAEVHQAAGVLTAHLGISIDEALLRLRAHAWRHNLPLLHVARAIISGHLQFTPD
ncbi:GAF and ANTAR domain-containing protein [Streptomyces kanamyceticus]|uniref:ANTAR domain-containing protein n=1 Tax=Streptomyces kanamyceticus TaxID=1967 RepID=A0A5J6GHK2_STRKN|nr:GAF and ANTAR domain-containing protein [Streptomyces kanamyceticus]QEU93375.1 ANTAR domain-containing protein [Streptomyces kanamyceticus]